MAFIIQSSNAISQNIIHYFQRKLILNTTSSVMNSTYKNENITYNPCFYIITANPRQVVILLSANRCAKHDARNFVQNMRKKDAQKEYLHTSFFANVRSF